MIALTLYVIAGVLLVLAPVVLAAKWFEWRAWDADRRIQRLRDRRTRTEVVVDAILSDLDAWKR